MTDQTPGVPDLVSRFTDARGAGRDAGGLVQVEVDGTGEMLSLVIDPRAMRLPSTDLAGAVLAAFRAARAEAQATIARAGAEEVDEQDLAGDLGSMLAQVQDDARRRLGELTTIARQIADRLDRLG